MRVAMVTKLTASSVFFVFVFIIVMEMGEIMSISNALGTILRWNPQTHDQFEDVIGIDGVLVDFTKIIHVQGTATAWNRSRPFPIFIHIPKNGGTFIEDIFKAQLGILSGMHAFNELSRRKKLEEEDEWVEQMGERNVTKDALQLMTQETEQKREGVRGSHLEEKLGTHEWFAGDDDVDKGLGVYKTMYISCSQWHCPPEEFVPESFAVIRNPFERTASEFCYSVRVRHTYLKNSALGVLLNEQYDSVFSEQNVELSQQDTNGRTDLCKVFFRWMVPILKVARDRRYHHERPFDGLNCHMVSIQFLINIYKIQM